ncbi:MAG: sodium-dependent transporter [Xanthomonadales bacterium]|nr:sodium-dependent transporter [Xanthomonadales bacterium]
MADRRDSTLTGALFSNRLTTLLTMAGVAIGLANVWRFPYMMGSYGGSAFLFLYLLLMALFAIPVLMAEWTLGRSTRSETIGALGQVFGKFGRGLGIFLVIGILVADSYYMVVIGNMLYTTAFSAWPGFSDATQPDFQAGLTNRLLQYGCALAILLAGLWTLHRGLHRGIESVSRAFVPLFGVVVIYLVFHTLTLPGALSQLTTFLKPDFSRIGPTELYAAAGQALFSLGVGGTLMVIYGTHLQANERIPRQAVLTGITDVAAALLAGLFIVPAVLVFGLDLAAGPALVFHTLPELFAVMPLGRVVGSAFLVALTLMAFLSAIAALHVGVGAAERIPGISATGALVLVGVVEAALMLPSALVPSLIGILDLIFGSGLQLLGASIAVIAVAWGLGRAELEASATGWLPITLRSFAFFWFRWVIPGVLLAILIGYIIESIQS